MKKVKMNNKKISSIVLILLILLGNMLCLVKAEERTNGKVYYKKVGQEYIVYYFNLKGEEKLHISYPREPVITKHGDYLVEVRESLGNPNTYSLFINIKNDTISEAFNSVLAVTDKEEVVAIAGTDAVILYRIFNSKKELMKIKRNFSLTASLVTAIREVKFLDSNKLYLSYLQGKDFKEKNETLQIPTF
jgi:hypothetical protein